MNIAVFNPNEVFLFMKLRNTELFNKILNEKYPDKDYEVIGEYVFNTTPILVRGIYGDCLITPNQLMVGAKPNIRAAIDKTQYTLNRFKEIHGDKYRYPNFEYESCNQIIEVQCLKHGKFFTKIPSHYSGYGCKKCGLESISDKMTSNTEDFIIKAICIHGRKFDYSKVNYKSAKDKITIICPIHGEFEQIPNSHLSGYGCEACAQDNKGFRKSKFCKAALGREAIFYVLFCEDENEKFFKIGITSRTVKARYSSKNSSIPYKYYIKIEYKSMNSSFIWDLERKFKSKYAKFKYKPTKSFHGSITECFEMQIYEEFLSDFKKEILTIP